MCGTTTRARRSRPVGRAGSVVLFTHPSLSSRVGPRRIAVTDPPHPPAICYQPFYCEENIWHLSQVSDLGGGARWVVFISNPSRRCLLLGQRAGGDQGEVVWDYHVVLFVERRDRCHVWDLDCRGGAPLPIAAWLATTFGHVGATPPEYDPMFRVIEAARFVEGFASDRRHMRAPGGWRAPPPPWPAIGAGFTLWDYVSMTPGRSDGEVLTLAALEARFAGR